MIFHKEIAMSKLDENNLTKLYKFLQLGGRYTTKELGERFEISTRTIQIYLKELRDNYGLQKEKRYYFFPATFRHIDMDKRMQMGTALMIALYKNTIPTIHKNVLENFKQIPKQTDAFLFNIDFEMIENETYFTQVIDAIIHQKAVHFTYKSSKNINSMRNVYPIKITNVLEYWYLMGYDLEQDKVKSFHFNNIYELIVSKDESYLTVEQIKKLEKISKEFVSPWFNDNKKSVSLSVSGDAMLYIKRKKRKELKIIKEHTDHLIVSMSYYGDVEVLTFVKKWLPDIEIVDNDDLQSMLHNILNRYLKK